MLKSWMKKRCRIYVIWMEPHLVLSILLDIDTYMRDNFMNSFMVLYGVLSPSKEIIPLHMLGLHFGQENWVIRRKKRLETFLLIRITCNTYFMDDTRRPPKDTSLPSSAFPTIRCFTVDRQAFWLLSWSFVPLSKNKFFHTHHKNTLLSPAQRNTAMISTTVLHHQGRTDNRFCTTAPTPDNGYQATSAAPPQACNIEGDPL
jgi:hypothetical protein